MRIHIIHLLLIFLIISCTKHNTYKIPKTFSENIELIIGKSLKDLKLNSLSYNEEKDQYELKIDEGKFFDKINIITKGMNKEVISILLLSIKKLNEDEYNLRLNNLYEECKALYGAAEKKATKKASPIQMEFYTWYLENIQITVVLSGTKIDNNGEIVRTVGMSFTRFR